MYNPPSIRMMLIQIYPVHVRIGSVGQVNKIIMQELVDVLNVNVMQQKVVRPNQGETTQ